MKGLIVISLIGGIALAQPISTPLLADDAHHPEKAAKAGKVTKAKPKQTKRPATKTDRSKQSETPVSLPASKG